MVATDTHACLLKSVTGLVEMHTYTYMVGYILYGGPVIGIYDIVLMQIYSTLNGGV